MSLSFSRSQHMLTSRLSSSCLRRWRRLTPPSALRESKRSRFLRVYGRHRAGAEATLVKSACCAFGVMPGGGTQKSHTPCLCFFYSLLFYFTLYFSPGSTPKGKSRWTSICLKQLSDKNDNAKNTSKRRKKKSLRVYCWMRLNGNDFMNGWLSTGAFLHLIALARVFFYILFLRILFSIFFFALISYTYA